MATIVTRSGKGSPLTNQELDNNFINVNTDKAELSGATFTGEIVAPSLDISGNIDVDGVTNLDVLDVDGAVDMASTLSVGGVVTVIDGSTSAPSITNAGDTNTGMYFDGADSVAFTAGGTTRGAFNSGGLQVVGALSATGVLTANAGIAVDNFTLDGTTLALSSGDLTLDVAGDIILDADGGDLIFKDGGSEKYRINTASGNISIENQTSNADIKFVGNDGGVFKTALALDFSAAGNATFNGTVLASNGTASLPSLSFSGDSNTGIYRSGSDNLGFAIGGQARAFMSGNQFNMTGNGIFSGNGTFGGTLGVTGTVTMGALAVGGTNTFTSKIVASAANGTAYSSNSQLRISGGGTNYNRASIVFSDDTLSDGKISYAPHNIVANRLLSLSARTTESDFVITGAGNVLVGKITPNIGVVGQELRGDGSSYFTSTNDTALGLNRLATDGTALEIRRQSSIVGAIGTYGGDLWVGQGNTGLIFNDGSDVIHVANASGGDRNGLCDLGSTASRWKDIHLAGGIHLGGTGTANKLDDYEIGTWTPQLRRNDGNYGANFNVSGATYVKIGAIVHLKAFISNISNGSQTGSSYWRIDGVPFASAVQDYSSVALAYNSTGANSAYVGDAGGNLILTNNANVFTAALGGQFMLSITFRVA